MGMSTKVIGLVDSEDPQHKKMVAAMEACVAASIPLPDQILRYFNGTANPDAPLEREVKFKKSVGDMSEFFDVAIADIPAGVKVIRFENSW